MNKGGFSWKRFVGISGAKARMSRKIGVPLTRSGRHQKIGRNVTGGGCVVPLLILGVVSGCRGMGREEAAANYLAVGVAQMPPLEWL